MATSQSFLSMELFDGSLQRAAARFATWYKTEFLALFSPATRAWMLDRGDRTLILRVAHGARELTFADGARGDDAPPISADELAASSLDEALARRGLSRQSTRIALELPREAFFIRRFDVPAAAQENLDRLLAAEIERKTPFRAADALFGHVAEPNPDHPDKLTVTQWIVRRDLVAAALDESGVALVDLDSVRPEAFVGEIAPAIVVARETRSSDGFRSLALALAALAVVLFVLGVAITVVRQDRIGSELDARLNDVSARATRVRQMADRAVAESRLLDNLRRERGRLPALADIWEDVSRVLPDGAYATEMRLSEARTGERLIDLVGFSDSAAGLPALFDRSPMFSGAALTSAITPDLREKREGFSLQMKVKPNSAARAP